MTARTLLPLVLAFAFAACNGDKSGETGHTGAMETGTDTMTTDTQTDTTSTSSTTSTGDARIPTILGLTADPTAGGETYAQICAACHGLDGTGTVSGPDLTRELQHLDDEQVIGIVLNGKGNMDAYDSLTNQQIADVVGYVGESFR
ncbi:MAG: cytochrome c [Myxococcota bacterium]